MGKLEQFKLRAEEHGQSITVYPFTAYPAGTYVDANAGAADPESATYPAAVPAVTYGTGVTVKGFVQKTRWQDAGKWFVRQYQGEEEPENWVAYLPGDQTVGMKDKLAFDNTEYEVVRIMKHWQGSTLVVQDCFLRRMTP